MSISRPKPENPCKKFVDFKGDIGQFFYWDKEKEVKVEIAIPIYFIVLDQLNTITGFNQKHNCGIYSNEVHKLGDELLRVRTFEGGEEKIGLYADIKDSIKAMGGKFTKSVYALLLTSQTTAELVNFRFKGISFKSWLESRIKTDNRTIGIVGFTEGQTGTVKYKIPVFKQFKLSDEMKQRAIAADEELQSFLDQYRDYQNVEVAKAKEKEIISQEALEESVRTKFEGETKMPQQEIISETVHSDDYSDSPDNLDDLPF